MPEFQNTQIMEHNLKPGLHLSDKYTVTEGDLASTIKTGDVHYASTPSLIILMEKVICKMLIERLGDEYTTVSAEINVKHMLPLSKGENVNCSVHLKFVEESKLFFDFVIFNSEEDIVAIGAHERVIVKKGDY